MVPCSTAAKQMTEWGGGDMVLPVDEECRNNTSDLLEFLLNTSVAGNLPEVALLQRISSAADIFQGPGSSQDVQDVQDSPVEASGEVVEVGAVAVEGVVGEVVEVAADGLDRRLHRRQTAWYEMLPPAELYR